MIFFAPKFRIEKMERLTSFFQRRQRSALASEERATPFDPDRF
jgi:hypothetical protein